VKIMTVRNPRNVKTIMPVPASAFNRQGHTWLRDNRQKAYPTQSQIVNCASKGQHHLEKFRDVFFMDAICISKITIIFSLVYSCLFIPFCEKRWKRWKRQPPQKLCGKSRSSSVISQAPEAKKAWRKVLHGGREKHNYKYRTREKKVRSGVRHLFKTGTGSGIHSFCSEGYDPREVEFEIWRLP